MRQAALSLLVSGAFLLGCDPNPQPRAQARKITSKKELIGGPHALGDIGDYLMQNGDARFIVQAEGFSRGFGMFGGSLIDADIVRPVPPGTEDGPPGEDNFGEMFPAFFLVAMEPRAMPDPKDRTRLIPAMEVLPTAEDGSVSVVVRGLSNQFIALTETINNLLVDPEFLRFESVYRLPARGRALQITTTVFNDGPSPHQFRDKTFTADIKLDVPFGDVLLFGAGNKVFSPADGGFDMRYRLEERYREGTKLPALPGLVTDFLASAGKKVSYGFFLPEDDNDANFVMQHAAGYGDRAKPGRFSVPFYASAFTGVFHAQPPRIMQPGDSFSFTRYFVVGDGDIASIASEVYRVRNTTVGQVTGRVLDPVTGSPVVGASVVVLDVHGQPVSQAWVRDGGLFTLPLPPGDYRVTVVAPERHPSVPVPVTVSVDHRSYLELRAEATGRLTVMVSDEDGAPLPAKVTLVGEYPESQAGREPRTFLFNLALGESWRGTDLVPDAESGGRRYVENAYSMGHGVLDQQVRPGTYDLIVSRGPEYDLHQERVEVRPGGAVMVTATLRRVVDTTGWLGSDLHIHSLKSLDSSLDLDMRVISYAAEGVDLMVATDHNYVTDFAPSVAANGLDPWLRAFVGIELTTMEMGHFNGYPLRYDSASPTHGSFEWSTKTPDQIFDAIRDMGLISPEETIVQVNHPRDTIMGYFNQFVLDQETGVIRGQTDPLMGINTTSYPNFAPEAFSWKFDAMEILNGKRLDLLHTYLVPETLPPPPLPERIPPAGQPLRDGEGMVAFPGGVDDWFMMLRTGRLVTGVANSDSHQTVFDEAGYPRTYLRLGTDVPATVTPGQLVDGIRSMNALMTNGPFLTVDVQGKPMGQLVRAEGGKVRVKGEVRTAAWVVPETLTIWEGGRRAVDLAIPPDQRVFSYDVQVEVGTDEDSFIVVEVLGGHSLFPVVTTYDEPSMLIQDALSSIMGSVGFGGNPYGNLMPARVAPVTPFAMTNPVFVDVDGNGSYDPPGLLPLPRPFPSQGASAGRPAGQPAVAQGPPALEQVLYRPVRGQAQDIRRLFSVFN